MSQKLPASVALSHSGTTAELTRDELTENGVVLSIDGAEQSHVELGDPEFLLHDYLRRMRSVLTASTPPTDSVLHLGAGALTLPRWIAHWRPETHQVVVDIEPELVGFVLEHLPMDPSPETLVADAAEVLTPGGALAGSKFGVVVVDLFNSAQAPDTLTSLEFFATMWGSLAPHGVMLVNFGDEAEMSFARRLTSTLIQTVGEHDDAAMAGRRQLPSANELRGAEELRSARQPPGAEEPPSAEQPPRAHALLSAPDDVLAARAEGNLVFAASRAGFPEPQLAQLWAAGPHPGDVLTGDELRAWSSARSY